MLIDLFIAGGLLEDFVAAGTTTLPERDSLHMNAVNLTSTPKTYIGQVW
jgi:hypothetical protein